MTEETRTSLYRDLKGYRGSMKKIAEAAEVHHSYVYMVLTGKRSNEKVLTAACKVLLSIKQKEAEARIMQDKMMREIASTGK